MSTLLFLLSLLLGFATFLGLLIPKLFVRITQKPSRKRVILFMGIPSIVLFYFFGKLYQSPLEEAMSNPEGTLKIRLANSKLIEVPEEVYNLANLKSLNLSRNNITSLSEDLLRLDQLEKLDLSDNPIDSVPNWLSHLSNLKELDLTNTKLVYLPSGIGHLNVSYEGTPLWKVDNPEVIASEDDFSTNSESAGDDHTESFGEFAMRSLLGNDYGHKRKFGKGEIYYDDPVTKAQADQVGEALTTLGLFNDEKSVSVLLDRDADEYILKMVVDEDKALDQEVITGFETIRTLIEATAFPEDKLSIHLTDDSFETIKTIN